ncbi:MAG: hypothetical protein IKK52_04040 [Alphaproteobacteria bacterium]|nr:hypothetical protein [Alphaproteobacteria bacterium]
MAVNITLTSSMRSNLSSLKSLASQMSTTQVRLSTGKKVNNAIDNANSYYQSRALTNRASDLDMLLDSMGQSIQTITSAVKGLEASGEILENAAVIAKQAYESDIGIPDLEWLRSNFENANTAIVASAQELYDAIAANKSTICIYGDIEIDRTITLNNQKLVGINHFGNFTENSQDYFSTITYHAETSKNMIVANGQSEIASLNVNFDATKVSLSGSWTGSAIYLVSGSSIVKDVNVDLHIPSGKANGSGAAIKSNGRGTQVTLQGNVNVDTNVWGVFAESGSKIIIEGAVKCLGSDLHLHNYSSLTLKPNGAFKTNKGIALWSNSRLILEQDSSFITNSRWGESIGGEAKIQMAENCNLVNYASRKAYKNLSDYNETLGSSYSGRTFDKMISLMETEEIDYDEISAKIDNVFEPKKTTNYFVENNLSQYLTAMSAFDEMVADSSYQGVNLLKGGKLTTMFNEDRTHSYTINGKDMSLSGLGINTREWQTKGDIAASIKEIQNAMSSIRDEVSRLGNSLSIIETRMNFTDGLVDVLQTGADDLVLADMNEESANYLALQTRNNLAVNALSLAAQSNNAVLKLF